METPPVNAIVHAGKKKRVRQKDANTRIFPPNPIVRNGKHNRTRYEKNQVCRDS